MPNDDLSVALRRATADDAYVLWLWANDPETRLASFGRGDVDWASHIAWLTDRLRRDDHAIFIAHLASGQPLGSIRFDSGDGWQTARLSYLVAAEVRGRGYASRLLAEGVSGIRDLHPGVRIYAEVARDNVRSMRAFRRASGWVEGDTRVADVATFWNR